jgi:outer membrane biosynthesis protein TonB
MGATSSFRVAEPAGLAVAIALHAALGGVLAWQMADPPEIPVIKPPKGMVVSLATDVSLESTSPNPVAVARASRAPVRGDPVPDPAPEVESKPEVEPRRVTEVPRQTERKETRPAPRSPVKPKSAPKKATPKTPTKTQQRSSARSDESKTPKKGGGSEFDKEFGFGAGTNSNSNNTGSPGQNLGPSELAALDSAVGRLVRGKWQGRVPQGPDAEKLVTRVTFSLNPNGTLKGEPRVLGTVGITDLNRNQVGRHQEEAIRAIKLVGRFQLPFDVPTNHPGFTLKFDR